MNPPHAESGSYIVVGVDGSSRSRRALEWALVEGRTSRLPVLVINAWRAARFGLGIASRNDVGRERAERLVEGEVDLVVPEPTHDPMLVLSIRRGDPVRTLAAASRHAALLVLGGRDDGPIARGCREKVDCPVVVVTANGARRIERRERGNPVVS